MKEANLLLREIIEKIKLQKKEINIIEEVLNDFIKKLKEKIQKLGIDAEVFIGGSFAKNTIIKKESYDIDIFVRFNKKYKNVSDLLKKILERTFKKKEIIKIHGSRDYFRIKIDPNLFMEIIPVIKIKNPEEAENTTDLSYFHVKYIKKKIKSEKLLDEIRLAKFFCYVNNCYGAESYVRGFSGYALELLIYYYGSFLNFIKSITKTKEKIVIDIEKHFKNKQEIMMNLNTSKLKSPIILIDPTYKQRNVLAALSNETFEKFKEVCKDFLKKPNEKAFEIKRINYKEIKEKAKKEGDEFILLSVKTNKQEGDIAGSKLLKFFKFLNKELEKFFEIKNKGFNYEKGKTARYFFVVKRKREILIEGPYKNDKINVRRFKKEHKNIFTKNEKIYAIEKVNFNIKKFVEDWKNKNRKRMKEMGIKELKIIE